MPRTRRPRVSWFRFFVDDFSGGTAALTAQEVGQYVLLLCAQWGTKEEQAIPADVESLTLICHGVMPTAKVLSKFKKGPNGLRNQRLTEEWEASRREYEGKSGRSKVADTVPLTAPEPEPEPYNRLTDLPTAREDDEGIQGGHGNFQLPRLDRAEEATKNEHRRLQQILGGLLCQLSEHRMSRRMVPAWCKAVTKYGENAGVSDYRMVSSIDRLEKSIEDAQAWLKKLDMQAAATQMGGINGKA